MPEPTSSTAAGLTAALILFLGPKYGPLLAPLFGEYLLVLSGAVVGIMHPASLRSFETRSTAVMYVLKWVASAVLLTGFVSTMIDQAFGLKAANWPGVVAWTITFFADKWRGWLYALGDAAAERFGRRVSNDKED